MTKTNDTLVEDMENVILGLNGWDNTLAETMASTATTAATGEAPPRPISAARSR